MSKRAGEFISPFFPFHQQEQEQNIGTFCTRCPRSLLQLLPAQTSLTLSFQGVMLMFWLRQQHSELNQPQLFILMLETDFLTASPQPVDKI